MEENPLLAQLDKILERRCIAVRAAPLDRLAIETERLAIDVHDRRAQGDPEQIRLPLVSCAHGQRLLRARDGLTAEALKSRIQKRTDVALIRGEQRLETCARQPNILKRERDASREA